MKYNIIYIREFVSNINLQLGRTDTVIMCQHHQLNYLGMLIIALSGHNDTQYAK